MRERQGRMVIIFRRSWLELFDVVTARDIAEILANAAGRKAIDYLSLYPIRWMSYRPHDDLAREQAQRGDWYEATGPADRQEHVNLIWRLASRVRVGILLDDGLAHPAKAEDGGKLVVERGQFARKLASGPNQQFIATQRYVRTIVRAHQHSA